MGITVGHDPDMSSLLSMSYLAGLGNFNRWQSEYQQRGSLSNAQMQTQGNVATAGNMTNAFDSMNNAYARQMYLADRMGMQYGNQMNLSQLRAELQLRNAGLTRTGLQPACAPGGRTQ